jgi:hypothetical protein
MNESDLPDDRLERLLRASTPEPLPDDGFVARAMSALDQATRAMAAPSRPAPVAPIVIARALAAEHRRHEAQARLWRWAVAGVLAGFLLLVAAVALSPDGSVTIAAPPPQQWTPLSLLLAAGAVWYAWRESRRN